MPTKMKNSISVFSMIIRNSASYDSFRMLTDSESVSKDVESVYLLLEEGDELIIKKEKMAA